MKLYTRPRQLMAGQLRRDDEIALFKTSVSGIPINDHMTLIDADMDLNVRWVPVHSMAQLTAEQIYKRRQNGLADDGKQLVSVVHGRGEVLMRPDAPVFAREVIELDPLTYVRTVMGDTGGSA